MLEAAVAADFTAAGIVLTVLVLAMAPSANFPAFLLSFAWSRCNTAAAVAGITVGTGSA